MFLEMVFRVSCFIALPGIKVRLTGLLFPGSSFLKTGMTLAFLQSSGTSRSYHDHSKIIESDFKRHQPAPLALVGAHGFMDVQFAEVFPELIFFP